MIKASLIFGIFLLFIQPAFSQSDSVFIREIYDQALVNGQSHSNLKFLCKKIGPRLSGSPNAQRAVYWAEKLMKDYGFDRVFLQPVMVPHWIRGEKETARIISIKSFNVNVTALGGTIGTSVNGLTAPVIEVHALDELKQLGRDRISGKIVFFNRKFDPKPIETGDSYSQAIDQRYLGPSEAAKFGAVGVIVRSLTHSLDDYPHTGFTKLTAGFNIPAIAISTNGADLLSKELSVNPSLKFYFKQQCKMLPDVLSYNVIGEIKGSEMPNEIITVGGHLDSWDLAEGAHDDGTGVVQSIEVLRIFKAIKYKPKKTIRAVLFMNEENGVRGGNKYAELAKENNEKHVAAIESDEGGFTPRGFNFDASNTLVSKINSKWKKLFTPYYADQLVVGFSGSDIIPLREAIPGVVLIGFKPDSQRYFDIHHTANDVFENVHKRELELGAASIAALVYLIDRYGFN